ncbi:UNVERIFIED_CONTAM: hypothetical protein HDU68_000708 [Siphonaria sp. JEL0065]|nr:hypothetical protein HDU68_000708 [Siphonaria sp. JEL0065]
MASQASDPASLNSNEPHERSAISVHIEAMSRSDTDRLSVTVQSADTLIPPNLIDILLERPPSYDGPIPVGWELLAFVSLEFNKAPEYFETNRPNRLEGLIPAATYTNRMKDLNAALYTMEGRRSIFWIRYYRVLCFAMVVVSTSIAGSIYVAIGKGTTYVFVPVLVPLAMLIILPTNAKWSKEDSVAGTELWYFSRAVQDEGMFATVIHVKIAIFEKAGRTGVRDRGIVSEELPAYDRESL